MSRGGRGGGAVGRSKNQPDFSWDDEEQPAVPNTYRPQPTFPRLDLPVPRPIDEWESASVKAYLSFRTRCHHSSPFYSTLDPSTQTDDKGKVDKRAGVDPFNDQDVYSKRFERRKRTEPDLSGRRDGYSLQFFPKELWPLLDPKQKHPLWATLDDDDKLKVATAAMAARKRKRTKPLLGAAGAAGAAGSDDDDDNNNDKEGNDSDDEAAAARRRKKEAAAAAAAARASNQKRGLDAEDDYPEDQNEDEDGGEDDEEPQDSEFEEDDEDMNDYNAEQYFDDGDDGDMGDDGGGDGDDGGTY